MNAVEQCGNTELHDPHDACAGLSEYDAIVTVKCPDCEAPRGQGCRFGTVSGADSDTTIAAEDIPQTAVHAGRRDLAFTERGTCKLCGAMLLHDKRTGRVWHPTMITQACPPLPDPRTDWNAYALAVQNGAVPGEPGAENFVPERPALLLCRECRDGKHPNCDGQAWDQAADEPAPCECPEHDR